MNKKSYLIITTTLLFVLVGGMLYTNTAIGKTPQLPTSKTVIVYDDVFSANLHQYTYITSFEPENFKYMNIMAQASGVFEGHDIIIYPFVNNLGVQVFAGPAGEMGRYIPYVITQTNDINRPDYGGGVTSKLEIYGQSVKLYMWVDGTENFNGHLKIVIYFTEYVAYIHFGSDR